jgi:hypothetical protein
MTVDQQIVEETECIDLRMGGDQRKFLPQQIVEETECIVPRSFWIQQTA